PFPGSSPRRNLLTRIGDTDLWYRTFKFPGDARFLYRLSPNDPLRFRDYESKGPPSQLDPLNPRQRLGWSLVELPSAPPQPYAQLRAGVPEGQAEHRRFASEILGNERDVDVYTPPSYSPDGSDYALLVVLDLEEYRKGAIIPTPTILDNLIAEKRIPPTVAVL